MNSGYCFELRARCREKDPTSRRARAWRRYWRRADDERWDTEVYTPTGTEREVGTRRIDGTPCRVWACQDGLYRAQTRLFWSADQ